MMEHETMPADAPETTPGPSVGQRLREARVRMGMSIEEVVDKIKIAPRQIVALEEDDFQNLPETAFLRGFVRSYAKLLNLDAQPLLDALPGAPTTQPVRAVDAAQIDAPFPTERSARRQSVNLLMAALLVTVGIAGFAVWQARTPHPTEKPVTGSAMVETPLPLSDKTEILGVPEVAAVSASAASAAQAAVPVATPAIPPAAVPASAPAMPAAPMAAKDASLRLVFDRESWTEIRDQTGKPLSRQVNAAGSELRVEGTAPFLLVVGHAASVHLYYRGKPVDLNPYINASSDVARLTLE